MFVHMVLEGVANSALGVGLDVVGTAAELVGAGLTLSHSGTGVLRQRVVSLDGQPVRSAAGRTVAVDGEFSLRGLRKGDVVVLPGMFAASGRTVEKLLARKDTQLAADLVAKAAAKGVMIAASCSATFVLAASGLLDGRRDDIVVASVDEIATQVGYTDAASFRRVFRRFAGESPRRRRGPDA